MKFTRRSFFLLAIGLLAAASAFRIDDGSMFWLWTDAPGIGAILFGASLVAGMVGFARR